MPDYALNRLQVIGNENRVRELFNFIKNEPPKEKPDHSTLSDVKQMMEVTQPTLFDFNKVIPLISIDPYKITPIDLGYHQAPRHIAISLVTGFYKDRGSGVDWYNLAIAAWGTKWNAIDTVYYPSDKNSLFFTNPWSPPEKVIKRLAELYPDLTLRHTVTDEGLTYVYSATYSNGKQISRTDTTVYNLFTGEQFSMDHQSEALLKEIGMIKQKKRKGDTQVNWSRPKWAYADTYEHSADQVDEKNNPTAATEENTETTAREEEKTTLRRSKRLKSKEGPQGTSNSNSSNRAQKKARK